ncbi:MAG: FAD-dependent oxidoreductase [Dehalococcoidales bacterium]|nr:FAD-dependent oxidoreductase [Dehalococcoidales bacterium]
MRKVDVAVIGGGPAGLAAGIKAKESGLDEVVVIERGEYLGGLLDQCIHNGFGLTYFGQDLTGPEYSHRFIEKARDLKVECLLKSMVVRLYPDRRLLISNEKGLTELSAQAIVLAMGCRERTREALNISGTRPAGILTAGAAQRYVNVYGYIPGKEVVILGSGDVGMIMARRLALEGVEVKAVVEVLPYVGGLIRNEVQCLQDFDIPLLLGHTISEFHGKERVEGVTISRVDKKWNPVPGTEQQIKCDTVLISAGLIPENELSRMASIELDPVTGGPVVNNKMETSVCGIFAGGNVLHVNDLVDNVTLEAEYAGASAADYVRGKGISSGHKINIKAESNIRYIVPQTVAAGENVVLSLRVKEPAEKVRLQVGNILTQAFRVVKPSQMIKLELTSKEWQKMEGEVKELKVNCTAGGKA